MKYLELETCYSADRSDSDNKGFIAEKGYNPPSCTGSIIYSILSIDLITSGPCFESVHLTYPYVVIRVVAERDVIFVCLYGDSNVSKFLTQYRSPSQPVVSIKLNDIGVSSPYGIEIYDSTGKIIDCHSMYMEKSKGDDTDV